MRKKIILGIVVLAAIVGAVYFNMNYAIVYEDRGTKKCIVSANVTEIIDKKYDWETFVKCTPSLKKLTKLKSIQLIAEEDMNLKYLSKMKNLNELTILYFDSYNECKVKFETLPNLPNLKKLFLMDLKFEGYQTHFTLPDGIEYNFDSIETLVIYGNQYFDIDCLKHFKKLKNLEIATDNLKLTDEQIEELQSRGITVKFL